MALKMKKRVLVVPWSMEPIYQFLVFCAVCSAPAPCVLAGSSTPLVGRFGEESGIDAIVNGRFSQMVVGSGEWGVGSVHNAARETGSG